MVILGKSMGKVACQYPNEAIAGQFDNVYDKSFTVHTLEFHFYEKMWERHNNVGQGYLHRIAICTGPPTLDWLNYDESIWWTIKNNNVDTLIDIYNMLLNAKYTIFVIIKRAMEQNVDNSWHSFTTYWHKYLWFQKCYMLSNFYIMKNAWPS